MKLKLDPRDFRFDGDAHLRIKKAKTKVASCYRDGADYDLLIKQFREEINALQEKMYAHDRYGMLLIFQAMDAAGKDGTIQHVLSGVNPHGVDVHAFKRPSDEELDHDYLWRTNARLPQRGRITIFNRSYYEEVLVCRVHPEIVTRYQRLPEEATKDMDKLYSRRLDDIRGHESFLHRNGFRVVKFMLHVSKEEQRKRFLERIATPAKNWKFNEADVKERAFWADYMAAYEDAINSTATAKAPWYVVPADDKKNMRLIVSAAILHEMKRLDTAFPTMSDEQKAGLARCKKALLAEK